MNSIKVYTAKKQSIEQIHPKFVKFGRQVRRELISLEKRKKEVKDTAGRIDKLLKEEATGKDKGSELEEQRRKLQKALQEIGKIVRTVSKLITI